MNINTIVQVAIGMIFVWITLAVITSQVQEWIASRMAWRASMLESTIINMLGDKNLTDKIYSHPLIKGLWTNNGQRKPGGIPEDKFALVLFEAVTNADPATAEIKDTFQRLQQNVAKLKTSENHELKNFATSLDTLMLGIEQKADNTSQALAETRKRVEGWFNNSMDRLGGAYRRRTQIIGIIVGIVLAAVLNVDSAAIAKTLWQDPVLREAVVSQANQTSASAQPGAQAETPSVESIMNSAQQLNLLSLPIGWSADNRPKDFSGWITKIIGILFSGAAAAQGAPYWFDLMRKLLSRSPEPAKAAG